MDSLLIDYENIIKRTPKGTRLKQHILPIPDTPFSLGLILLVPSSQIDHLHTLSKGCDRVDYLNTQNFVDSIKDHAYIVYDKHNKICEIKLIQLSSLKYIMQSILTNLPNDIVIWIGVELDNPDLSHIVEEYTKQGFTNPYICKSSPLGYIFGGLTPKRGPLRGLNHQVGPLRGLTPFRGPLRGLCMLKENNVVPHPINTDTDYVLSHANDMTCQISLCLNDNTIKYLKQLCNVGSTINRDGIITQKEVAGSMNAKPNPKGPYNPNGPYNPKGPYQLEINYDSIIHGQEEGVSIVSGLYNFHSHPKAAYTRNNVKLAWPSAQDYIGFILSTIEYNTICHMVIGMEGIYIMSIHPIQEPFSSKMGKFIHKSYDFCYKPGQTSEWYVEKVNSILYNGHPIFDIQFLDWTNTAKPFVVHYKKINGNCFAMESTLEKYKRLYNKK